MKSLLLLSSTAIAAWLLGGVAMGQTAPPPSEHSLWRNVEIGGGGGFVDGIVFSPKRPDVIYARTDIGGAYRWDVGVRRWVALTDWVGQDNGNLRGAESIALDPTDPNRVYIAAGTYLQPGQKTAILRSADGGRTWATTPMPLEMGGNEDGRSIGERLAVDPNRPNLVYFGSRRDGLWRSQDYGATWAKLDSFPAVPNDPPRAPGAPWAAPRTAGVGWVVFDAHSGPKGHPTPTLYAGIAAPGVPTILRSTDAGVSWQPVPGQPQNFILQHGVLDTDGSLYITYGNALGPNGVSDGAVWKMDTRTGAWTDITPIKPAQGGFAGLALDARHPGTVMVSTLDHWSPSDDIFRSTDGGAHWKALSPQATRDPAGAPWLKWGGTDVRFGWWIGALAIDPFHSGRVLYGTGATIWGSEDVTQADLGRPTHWKMYAEGIEETAVTALLSPPAGPPLLSGLGDIGGFTHERLDVSPPGGMPTPVFGGTSGLDVAWLQPSLIVRVGSTGRGINPGACSRDGGRTWTAFAAEPPGSRGGGAVAVTADGAAFVWAAQGAPVSVTHDGGRTWTACQGLPQPAPHLSLAADRADKNRVYALDGDGHRLFVSQDGGTTFVSAGTAGLPAGGSSLAVLPGKAGDLWVTVGDHGLYRSTDGGASFAALPSVASADGVGFGKAAPGHAFPAVYLVGTPSGVSAVHGVYRSDNSGTNWVRINDDQHQYGWIGRPVTGDPRVYGRVYLGTNGRGILYADPAH